jgi:hypothetical protein
MVRFKYVGIFDKKDEIFKFFSLLLFKHQDLMHNYFNYVHSCNPLNLERFLKMMPSLGESIMGSWIFATSVPYP